MESARIAIKTSKGLQLLDTEDILYCRAQGRYTKIITVNGKEYFMTRVLKNLEDSLPDSQFFRTHKSYLINLNHIVNYHHNDENPITLIDETKICLAKRRKQEFQKRLRELVRTI